MKKYSIIFIFSLIFVMLASDLEAQQRRRRYKPRRAGSIDLSSVLHTVNLGIGYYTPKMDYWNEESFLVESSKKFDWGLMFYGGVDFKLYEDFLIGIYGGTYADRVKSYSMIGLIEREETLRYRITPLSLIGKYEWSFWNPRQRYRNRFLGKIHPYVGGGINYTLINLTLSRKFTDPERENQRAVQSGSTISYSAIGGVKYDITDFLGAGFEVNYYFGNFDQRISTEGNETSETVSITGPSFNVMVYYKFGGKYGSYNRRRARYR